MADSLTPPSMFVTPIPGVGVPAARKIVPLIRINGQVQEALQGMKIPNEYLERGSGAGAEEFIDLTDVPASYSGKGNWLVWVKQDESGLEFVEASDAFGDPL